MNLLLVFKSEKYFLTPEKYILAIYVIYFEVNGGYAGYLIMRTLHFIIYVVDKSNIRRMTYLQFVRANALTCNTRRVFYTSGA